MALIYWMPEYNTGIEVIDQQHHILVDLINELYQAQENGAGNKELLKILGKVGMYATSHFAREENLFEVHNYPEAEEHIQEHNYFEDMLFQFEDECKAGRQDLTENAISFLSDWLVNHLNGTDKEYVPYLKSRGVS
jgi:hemerythrin-like metal-binding protein